MSGVNRMCDVHELEFVSFADGCLASVHLDEIERAHPFSLDIVAIINTERGGNLGGAVITVRYIFYDIFDFAHKMLCKHSIIGGYETE